MWLDLSRLRVSLASVVAPVIHAVAATAEAVSGRVACMTVTTGRPDKNASRSPHGGHVGSVVGAAARAASAGGIVHVAAVAFLAAVVVAAMPVGAVRDGAPAPADGVDGAAVATAAEIAAGALAAAVLGAAVVVTFRSVAAAAAWAAPATPSAALGTVRPLGRTMFGWDWIGKDRWELGCHGGLSTWPKHG